VIWTLLPYRHQLQRWMRHLLHPHQRRRRFIALLPLIDSQSQSLRRQLCSSTFRQPISTTSYSVSSVRLLIIPSSDHCRVVIRVPPRRVVVHSPAQAKCTFYATAQLAGGCPLKRCCTRSSLRLYTRIRGTLEAVKRCPLLGRRHNSTTARSSHHLRRRRRRCHYRRTRRNRQ